MRLWHGWSLGTAAFSLFVVQVITGVVLMAFYSPATTTAWGSTWYIQTKVSLGWLVRGMHHFASDALIMVLGLWALQVVLVGAYRRAHATLWWSLLGLIGIVLGLSLTGHLLPWDQEGFWGTQVRTNILARSPVIGESLKRILIGGAELGQFTLTRFYTLHVLILPCLVALILWKKCKACGTPDVESGDAVAIESPEQAKKKRQRIVRVSAACFVGVLLAVGYTHFYLQSSLLDAPADATAAVYPARPEWHTLFLFQWLKYFQGPTQEVLGAIVAPAVAVLVLVALPFLDRWLHRMLAQILIIPIVLTLVGGVAYLTVSAMLADANPSDQTLAFLHKMQQDQIPLDATDEATIRARVFNEKRQRARRLADRALELADTHGIPPAGPLALLMNDPQTRGPALFAANCATCHRFYGHDGTGVVPTEPAESSDLGGFASRGWIRGLLTDPMDEHYFGLMKKPDGEPAHTRMSDWIQETLDSNDQQRDRAELMKVFDAVAAYLEDESLHPKRLASWNPNEESDASLDEKAEENADDKVAVNPDKDVTKTISAPLDADALVIRRGRRIFMSVCNECHSYDGEREGTLRAPEMAGYGSVDWIELMIAHPEHETRYRSRGKEPAQMPAFADRLSEKDRHLLATWLHANRQTGPMDTPN